MADFSYIGVGKVYLREAGAAAGLVEVGNCSALAFNVNEDVRELKDYTQAGGGTYSEVRRIESVEATMTLHDLNASNLARALFGSTSAFTATPVVDEVLIGYPGAFTPTAKPIDTSVAPVLTNSGATQTYVLGTDYTVTPSGIEIPATGSAITTGQSLRLDYTPKAGNAVEALTNSAKEYELFFAGLNEARSGKTVNVNAYRLKLGAAQNLALIGDDYAALELTGKVLKDTTKTGVGVSQYFKAQIVT